VLLEEVARASLHGRDGLGVSQEGGPFVPEGEVGAC
jgi:hypothetical protein